MSEASRACSIRTLAYPFNGGQWPSASHRTIERMKILAVSTLFLCCTVASARAQHEHPRLDRYWPLDAPQRGWRLVSHGERSRHMMTVTHTNVGEGCFWMWFSDKPGQADGLFHVEQFTYRENRGGMPWLWLDKYINVDDLTKERSEHAVFSTRILLTPAGGETHDLVADGTYDRCGARGQPYLLFDPPWPTYRLQVWGTIGEKEKPDSKYHWYWDATVHAADTIHSGCTDPPMPRQAIKVKEAWWCDFTGEGKWTAPGDGSLDQRGFPTGDNIKPFRTVWHADGKLPYFLIGTPDEAPNWCTSQIWDVKQD